MQIDVTVLLAPLTWKLKFRDAKQLGEVHRAMNWENEVFNIVLTQGSYYFYAITLDKRSELQN